MQIPNDDPDLAYRLSGVSEPTPYTTELEVMVRTLRRKIARLNNAIRLARTFSTERRVQVILDKSQEEE